MKTERSDNGYKNFLSLMLQHRNPVVNWSDAYAMKKKECVKKYKKIMALLQIFLDNKTTKNYKK